jgi:hypothetical protein
MKHKTHITILTEERLKCKKEIFSREFDVNEEMSNKFIPLDKAQIKYRRNRSRDSTDIERHSLRYVSAYTISVREVFILPCYSL